MTHPRTRIREAVRAQLVGTDPDFRTLAAARVFKTRVIPLKGHQLPAIMVYTLTEPAESEKTAPRVYKRDLELVIEGVVEADVDVDDALDVLAAQIECAMNVSFNLGVTEVADSVLNNTECELTNEGKRGIGLVRLTYTVTYYTEAPDADCAPTLDDFTSANLKWSLSNEQAEADQAEDTFDVEE